MKQNISFEKNKSLLAANLVSLIICSFAFLIPFIHGFSQITIILSFFISPVSLLSAYGIWGGFKNSKNKIHLTTTGLKVDDCKGIEIPWGEIVNVNIVVKRLYKQGEVKWLVVNTKNDELYTTKMSRKLNKQLGIDGIPLGLVTIYKESPETIKSAVIARIKL